MEFKNLLFNGFNEIGIKVDDKLMDSFIKYKDILLDWNQRINLTTIIDEKEIAVKHFIDSIIVLKYINLSNKKIIDVGTGAGFPGLPLKIVNESINITLLDSLNKRINFLDEIIHHLNLKNVELIHGRAEEFGVNSKYREKFDYCVSRAVANLQVLCEYCLPFVAIGGYFISLKGPKVEAEIDDAKKAISILGGKLEKVGKVLLPFSDISHSIIFIKKINQCPSNYPRKSGKPSKEPIK